MQLRLIFLALALCAGFALADDRQPPASWSLERAPSADLASIDIERFGALDLEALADEDAARESMGGPPRFAFGHETSIRADQRGSWEVVGDTHVWRFRVHAEEATLINFGLHDLFLPEGSQLYIYSAKAAERRTMDRFAVIGPYDNGINRSHGEFWTPNLSGDQAIIEVNVPADLADQFSLSIAQVSHGYRGFGESALAYRQNLEARSGDGKQACREEGGARSGACNQDVACLSEDDPWNDPRRSVGAYQRSGVFACTGSLVNNTAQDQRMLFITARHCISEAQASSIVVYWNYEWPTCRRPGAPEGTQTNAPDPNITNSGGTFLASTSNPFQGNCTAPDECSDVYLLELDDPANPDFELHWSGWDRRPPPTVCAQGPGNSTAGLCATIHHPGVDEKRITWVAQDMQVGNIAGAQNIHWHPFWHPNPPELPNMPGGAPATIPPAVTEPGSSGSPLYTADRRFIGVLSGGPAFCGATGANLSDFYGGLWHAWDGMGTPTTRMRDYLDPLGTEPLFIDGTDGDGFELVPDTTAVSQCSFDDVEISIEVNALGEFEGDVDLSLSGLDPTLSSDFSVNPVTPPGTTVLTIGDLAVAGPGSYNFSVDGVSGDFDASVNISLFITEESPDTTTIVSPADGQSDVSSTPTISWGPVDLASTYEVQVATDVGFTDIVFSEVTSQTEATVSPSLSPSTQYFVRVRASNDCDSGDWSAISNFTTANEICISPGASIPDNSPAGLNSEIEISQAGQLLSLEMSLDITHTWVGDLIINLTHVESGTTINLVERANGSNTTFGCSSENIQTNVSDDAPVSLQMDCVDGGNPVAYPEPAYSPNDPLASFVGQDIAGTWRLNVSDNAAADTGTLNSWCLIPSVGTPEDEIFDDRFEAND
jgi:lysyl endopeptidase